MDKEIGFDSFLIFLQLLPINASPAAESAELIRPVSLPIIEPPENSNFQIKKLDVNGAPFHWDTCKEFITWTIFPGAPEKTYALAAQNFQTLANATGFSFKYVDSLQLPAPKTYREAEQLDYANIQMYYGLRSTFVGIAAILNGNTNGINSGNPGTWSGTFFETSKQTIGQVVDFQYPANDFAERGLGIVMLHELGHAMGLAHAQGDEDVMGKKKPRTGQFGPGDLSGLYKLTAGIPCVVREETNPTASSREETNPTASSREETNPTASSLAKKIICVKGKLKRTVKGVDPVCPKGYKKKGYKKKSTITCTKGKKVKKVTAVIPKCPKGYKKK